MADRTVRHGGLPSCIAGVVLGSIGTLAVLLVAVPSLRAELGSSIAQPRGRRRPGAGSRSDDAQDVVVEKGNQQNDSHCEPSNGYARPNKEEALMDSVDLPLRLLSKAEGVVRYRSSLLVVIERCVNDFNYSAILRTAEALGVQDVWLVDPPVAASASAADSQHDETSDDADGQSTTSGEHAATPSHNGTASSSSPPPSKLSIPRGRTEQEQAVRSAHHLFAQKATNWLTLREFATSSECLHELRKCGYQVWATDLSQHAVPLVPTCMPRDLPAPDGKVAVVLGTEAVGVSQEMLDASDMRVYLPLRGFADSLNLSVAAALVIHQVLLLYPDLIGNYPNKDELRQLWFAKLATRRLMTPRQKKDHRKLQNQIADCQTYLQQQNQGIELSKEQLTKLDRLPAWEEQMRDMERAMERRSKSTCVTLRRSCPTCEEPTSTE